MAANVYQDNEDLRFYVERGLDWASLVEVSEWLYRAPDGPKDAEEALGFLQEIFELVGTFVAREIVPFAEEIDHEKVKLDGGEVVFGPRQARIFEKIKELGLHGLCVPRELGGLNAPLLALQVVNELMSRGDVSVAAHNGFHCGMAMAMLVYSVREGTTEVDPQAGVITQTRFADYIEEIVAGEAWGCMDITEPDAGSDMAKLRCVGEQDEDGQWFVSGTKIFITSGHGKYHFVIARTEAAADDEDPMAGLGGLSMFLVPAYEELEDGTRRRIVEIGRVEDKLGHNGSATCELLFERAPAMLIGERGEGFKYMLLLMNNARVGVGFECLGLCEAAHRMALDYAAERASMGKPIARHEMIADYLNEMERDIQAIRALAMHAGFHEEMSQKIDLIARFKVGEDTLAARRYIAQLKHHKRESRRLTPLLKYLAAEKAVEITRRAVQIHGGSGYTKDYGAEKLLRDAMVMPIYEGTSQIQALMVMKDNLMGVLKRPQEFVRELAQAQWRARTSRDPLERRLAKLQALGLSAVQHLLTRTATDKLGALAGQPVGAWPEQFFKNWNPKRDFAFAMLHAERLTRLLADVAVSELLFEQARAHADREEILLDYLERAEPRCRALYDTITTTGQRTLDRLAGEREAAYEQAQ